MREWLQRYLTRRSADDEGGYQTAHQSNRNGGRRTRVTNRQPQCRSISPADCRWHGEVANDTAAVLSAEAAGALDKSAYLPAGNLNAAVTG